MLNRLLFSVVYECTNAEYVQRLPSGKLHLSVQLVRVYDTLPICHVTRAAYYTVPVSYTHLTLPTIYSV